MSVRAVDAKLADALQEAGYPTSTISQARRGHWSDFKSPLDAPKMELVEMLREDGHDDLADRAQAGEFDG